MGRWGPGMKNRKYSIKHRLELFPTSTILDPKRQTLMIGGLDLNELAAEYGTPLYLYDQLTIQEAIQSYRQNLAQVYPASSGLTYAGKAYLCLAIARWMSRQGLQIDCSSANEIYIAQHAGVPRGQILQHGVNKSPQDLQSGLQQAGVLVVDNPEELNQLFAQLKHAPQHTPEIWLRWRPGLNVPAHSHLQTALKGSKFGFSSEEIFAAVKSSLEAGLPLSGLHFHLGSNLHELEALEVGVKQAVNLLAALRTSTGWIAKSLSPGGGLGIAYHEDDLPAPTIKEYVTAIVSSLIEACDDYALPLPHLQLEPGRSLVGRAGVALYRVGGLKQSGDRSWVLVDGGLADNPRPALYGTRYTALPVENVRRPAAGSFWLGGPACESGDILAENLPLPQMTAGEFLAIPASGAYQLSMSSRYNGAQRPAVLWLGDQTASLIQERETLEDIIRHDRLPL